MRKVPHPCDMVPVEVRDDGPGNRRLVDAVVMEPVLPALAVSDGNRRGPAIEPFGKWPRRFEESRVVTGVEQEQSALRMIDDADHRGKIHGAQTATRNRHALGMAAGATFQPTEADASHSEASLRASASRLSSASWRGLYPRRRCAGSRSKVCVQPIVASV